MADNINETLEDLTATLDALAEKFQECCKGGGATVDPPPGSGAPPTGEGTDYPDEQAYLDAKCNAANLIYDTIANFIDELATGDYLTKISAGFGAIGVIGGILALLGPGGWAIAGISAGLVGIVTALLALTIDLDLIADTLDDAHEDLVTALYNAETANTARQSFISAFEAEEPTLGPEEVSLVYYLLPNNLLNNLFEPTIDFQYYQSPDPIDCGSSQAILVVLPFYTGGPDAGVISGSNVIDEVNDQVVVTSASDAHTNNTHLVFVQRRVGGVPTPGVISANLSSWANYCANYTGGSGYFIQPGFQAQATYGCDEDPEDLTGLSADTWILRSNSSFTVTFTLES